MYISKKRIIGLLVILIIAGIYFYVNEPIKKEPINCELPINNQK